MHPPRHDVVIAGAGIVGLAHAYHAHRRGLSVAVLDRSAATTGSSVQNFGHCCVTAQSGRALEFARAGRPHWLELARRAGFWHREQGTLAVARAEDEWQVLREFAELRAADEIRLLDPDEVTARAPIADPALRGGALLPWCFQVDPRSAAPAIAAWLAEQGVAFHRDTAVLGVEPGSVRTTRGTFTADHVVVALNHDVGDLFPELADAYRVQRCRLHMLRADLGAALPLPVFTGWSMVRYSGFRDCPSTTALRDRLHAEHPELAGFDLNQMYTGLPDGSTIVGDTHARDRAAPPFQDERGFEVLLAETERLFGRAPRVRERWQGVYASAPEHEFMVERPLPGVRVVTVTTGIGMTTSMGLAESVLDQIASEQEETA